MGNQISYSIDTDIFRRNLLKYTRKAFFMIPAMAKQEILDVGCGSGIPTLELAQISGGHVTGIDIDQKMLDKLVDESIRMKLEGQIKVINCSAEDMDFHGKLFDIIWSEGSIHALGFENGLLKFRESLKIGGYLVIHDRLWDYEKKLALIKTCGFRLIGEFILTREIWEEEYYNPLKELIDNLQSEHGMQVHDLLEYSHHNRELEEYEKDPDACQSVFFVMVKE